MWGLRVFLILKFVVVGKLYCSASPLLLSLVTGGLDNTLRALPLKGQGPHGDSQVGAHILNQSSNALSLSFLMGRQKQECCATLC